MSVGFFDEALCTRCGTCGGACPENAIVFNEKRFPSLVPDRCTSCGLCKEVCPGDKVSYRDLSRITFGLDQSMTSFDGHVLKTYVGYCTDERIRGAAASLPH